MYLSIFFLIAAIIFNTVANGFFKYYSLHKDGKLMSYAILLVGFIFGGLNAIFYIQSLKNIKLNVAYTIFSAGSIILIALAAVLLYNEEITLQKIIGIGIVCVGIFVITY